MAGSYTVTLLSSAEKDLLDILRSVEKEYSNESAVKVHERILEALQKLEVMPSAYALYTKSKSKFGLTYRQAFAGKYLVVCRIEETSKDVFVIRVHHIKRGPEFYKKDFP